MRPPQGETRPRQPQGPVALSPDVAIVTIAIRGGEPVRVATTPEASLGAVAAFERGSGMISLTSRPDAAGNVNVVGVRVADVTAMFVTTGPAEG